MFRKQNLCPGSKTVFDLRQKDFLVSEQQNLFLQRIFPARLNWELFASATMFPSLARPLVFISLFKNLKHVARKKNAAIPACNIVAFKVAEHSFPVYRC